MRFVYIDCGVLMSWNDEAEYIRKQAKLNNEFFANSLPMIASENVLSPKEVPVKDIMRVVNFLIMLK